MLGWSQEYMGHQLGISQKQYSRLESGENSPRIDRLEEICKKWGMTFEQFMTMSVEELHQHVESHTNERTN